MIAVFARCSLFRELKKVLKRTRLTRYALLQNYCIFEHYRKKLFEVVCAGSISASQFGGVV